MSPNGQQDAGKLILRVALGVLILLHGITKLMGGISGIGHMLQTAGLPTMLAYGVLAGEVLAPLLLILGFYARVGAALIAINMMVAVYLAHLNQLTSFTAQGGWALELQGMFLFTAIALVLLGPGRYSVNGR